MIINTNMGSVNALNNLSTNGLSMSKSLEKLSSGMRINRAADDAAGLGISEKMRAQIKGLNQAQRNAQDGISLLQTAEGGMNEIHSILQRMRELAVEASNDTLDNASAVTDGAAIQVEFKALSDEIGRIATSTKFNGNILLDGSYTGKTLQVGADNATNNTLTVAIADMQDTGALAVSSLDVSSLGGAQSAITGVQAAIELVSQGRSEVGALQNRLEHAINNIQTGAENVTAAESRIRDVDMAKAMSDFTKNQILNQAGVAVLAQANQTPQSVLKLLG